MKGEKRKNSYIQPQDLLDVSDIEHLKKHYNVIPCIPYDHIAKDPVRHQQLKESFSQMSESLEEKSQ